MAAWYNTISSCHKTLSKDWVRSWHPKEMVVLITCRFCIQTHLHWACISFITRGYIVYSHIPNMRVWPWTKRIQKWANKNNFLCSICILKCYNLGIHEWAFILLMSNSINWHFFWSRDDLVMIIVTSAQNLFSLIVYTISHHTVTCN